MFWNVFPNTSVARLGDQGARNFVLGDNINGLVYGCPPLCQEREGIAYAYYTFLALFIAEVSYQILLQRTSTS